MIYEVVNKIKSNLLTVSVLLEMALPYLMLRLGIKNHSEWYIYLVPVLIGIVIWIMRIIANKFRKGNGLPIPRNRFTDVDDYGEVSISSDRLQELLIYMADLEDWIERKGLSKNENEKY